MIASASPLHAAAEDLAARFDEANKRYEEGAYTQAATLYQDLIEQGLATASVQFNLGNAWFKAGQLGRAIAAYRHGLRLDPRDPSLRFNLQFARQQVSGNTSPREPWTRRWLQNLTLNEWTVLASCALWLWFGLLCWSEGRPTAARKSLQGYTATAGGLAALLIVLLVAALRLAQSPPTAIVIVPQTVVRYGPLEESQVHYQLRDGAETVLLDEKTGAQSGESWIKIRDAAGREGWLRKHEAILSR